MVVWSGLSQGATLGPSLSNFYVKEEQNLLSNILIPYADDYETTTASDIKSMVESPRN